jgi:hypothetical protein
MPKSDHKAYKGWRGTIRAALAHHPEKFSKEACKGKDPGKLCPYAIFTKKKKEGGTPHYKEQPHTTSGTPKKKPEFKEEGFAAYVEQRDLIEAKKKKKMSIGLTGGISINSLNGGRDMP